MCFLCNYILIVHHWPVVYGEPELARRGTQAPIGRMSTQPSCLLKSVIEMIQNSPRLSLV